MRRRRPLVLFVQNSPAAHHPRHHYRLAAALRAAGVDARMLSQPDRVGGHVDAVPVERLPVRRSRLTRMASGPATMLRAARRRPDVIHVVSLELLPWAALLRRARRALVLYDSNEEYHDDMLHKEWVPPALRPALSRVVGGLEPRLGRSLDAVTTAVPATHARFEAAGARSVLVRNFPPARTIPERPERGPFTHEILVGGTVQTDMMPVLAETAARLLAHGHGSARWLCVLRDCGPDDEDTLEGHLRGYGVRDRVDILRNRPFTEMPMHMRRCRIGFVFFKGVGLPQRVFEYMAHGLPFVAADLPWVSDVVAGTGAGLLSLPHPTGYAETIDRLLGEEALQARMSEAGPRLVRTAYNWEHEADRLLGLYESLLGRPLEKSAAT